MMRALCRQLITAQSRPHMAIDAVGVLITRLTICASICSAIWLQDCRAAYVCSRSCYVAFSTAAVRLDLRAAYLQPQIGVVAAQIFLGFVGRRAHCAYNQTSHTPREAKAAQITAKDFALQRNAKNESQRTLVRRQSARTAAATQKRFSA